MESKIKNVAIYLRKSRAEENQEDVLENHRETLIEFCNEKGWKILAIYEDLGSSG